MDWAYDNWTNAHEFDMVAWEAEQQLKRRKLAREDQPRKRQRLTAKPVMFKGRRVRWRKRRLHGKKKMYAYVGKRQR